MKSTLIILFALIALTTCNISLFQNVDWTLKEDIKDMKSRKDDLADFFEGVFCYFNLSAPTQINACFKDLNSNLYFHLIQSTATFLQDTKERNWVHLHIEYVKLLILHKQLEQTHACMIMTQDFTDLLDALQIKDRALHDFKTAFELYYQAHYLDMYEDFKPVIDNLDIQSNREAGYAFGALLDQGVGTIKSEGVAHLALAGFSNGIYVNLGIDEPEDSLKCYDTQAAFLIMEFYYKLASSVAEGKVEEAPLNAMKFMEREGSQILSQIPKDSYQCDIGSNDHQAVTDKLGIDPAGDEFHALKMRFINDHRFKFYAYCKALKREISNGNMHHAGWVRAQFLKAVAASRR